MFNQAIGLRCQVFEDHAQQHWPLCQFTIPEVVLEYYSLLLWQLKMRLNSIAQVRLVKVFDLGTSLGVQFHYGMAFLL